MQLLIKLRLACVVIGHVVMVTVANQLAFELRFDGQVPPWAQAAQLHMLPWLVLTRGLVFVPFGVYRGIWRYAGIWDLRNIVAGVGVSSFVFYLVTLSNPGVPVYPRSVFIIDALLLICLVGGVRLAKRIWRDRRSIGRRRAPKARRVLIFGAGDAGELIVRDIKNSALREREPVGFVDDDSQKVGKSIHGVPVLGTRDQVRNIMARHRPDEVLIAMPAAGPASVRSIVQALETFNVQITVLPNLQDVFAGKVAVSQIRDLSVEDLLPRAPVGLDERQVRHLIEGRRVLVTGAGGSIGSELCRQIATLGPASLVLFERSENSLFAINNTLTDAGAGALLRPVVGDIGDTDHLHRTMAQCRPDIVFHAAAHKHVPLMEANPCEAIKNNVAGTRLVAEASVRHGVARFVMISTDKAVNPSSVMGATKRVAELIVMTQFRDAATSFVTVRFGNVLGSAGSAIPRFMDQISAGGPVTVTHPEIRRYFMLLPEAVQLVLHVAGHGRNGGVYVLDMGEQIKVVDMARNLIRLSGFVPDKDIEVAFIGLRPGEKLFEELVGANETVDVSPIEKVFTVTSNGLPSPAWLASEVSRLERFARDDRPEDVVRCLGVIVPQFRVERLRSEPAAKLRMKRVPLLTEAPLGSSAAG